MVPPTFHCTPFAMQEEDKQDRPWVKRLALPTSLALHAIVVALLIFGLPHSLENPQDEQAVNVDLVPPPKPPEKPKKDPPAARKPPAQKPPEQKPPAQKPPERPQEKAEAAPPPGKTPAAPPRPPPHLNPVFQYGKDSTGPQKSLDGDSAKEGASAPAEKPDTDAAKPAETQALKTEGEQGEISLPAAPETPTPRPANAAEAKQAPRLEEVKTLFSRSATGDSLAMTAMGDLPRSVRGGTLCVTELRAQLLHASPPYFPDLLPSFPLKDGTVIDVPEAAFRADGQWRNVGYRCEVDADATKVVSFAVSIGGPIPRSEWKQRGLPPQ
jgi:hypothetical protein